jgi:prepilin-type N-terminal cleavage/methylation domain-containing protein
MLRRQRGFTLLELVMVIVIIGVISVVIAKIMLQGLQSFATSQNTSEVDWQGLIAMERLTSDIHTIRSPSDITTITASQLTFTDTSGTSVQYSLSGNNLLRNSQILASGVTGLTFGYLSDTGATTATASAVRYISISLTLVQSNITTSFSTLVGSRGLP